MQTVAKTVAILLLATVIALLSFAYSGAYDVSATQADGRLLRWLLVTLRDRSIERRAANIAVPPLNDPDLIQEGFEHYHAMCTGCHLAPGMEASEIRQGLNPPPPILAQVVPHTSPAQLFWVIKHGVKMSGMPAWGASHSDQMIWAIVAFLERLPTMTPAQYQAMEKQSDTSMTGSETSGSDRP